MATARYITDNTYSWCFRWATGLVAGNTFNSTKVTRVGTSRLKIKKNYFIDAARNRTCDPRNGEVWYYWEPYPILDTNSHIFTILTVFQLFFLTLQHRVTFLVCSALLVISVQAILSNRLSVRVNIPALYVVVPSILSHTKTFCTSWTPLLEKDARLHTSLSFFHKF